MELRKQVDVSERVINARISVHERCQLKQGMGFNLFYVGNIAERGSVGGLRWSFVVSNLGLAFQQPL